MQAGPEHTACLVFMFQVLVKNGTRPPWKFIESIAIEEFTLGLVPPQFQFCYARYDPVKSMLTFSMDARFNSSAAQAVVSSQAELGSLLLAGVWPGCVT